MIENISLEELKTAVQNSDSFSQTLRNLGIHINGKIVSRLKRKIFEKDIDISHFDNGKRRFSKERKLPVKTKTCPVCSKLFETKLNLKEKTTCSRSCSNVYFRSGTNHPNWKGSSYRQVCFAEHGKKCIICKESLIVEAHHLDGNRLNHSVENLIPLCPTHHQYWHSSYRNLIESQVKNYVTLFLKKNNKL